MRRSEILVCLVTAASLPGLCGCNDTRGLAPASPDAPWQPAANTGLRMPPGARGFAAPVPDGGADATRAAASGTGGLDATDPRVGTGNGPGTAPLNLAGLIDAAERHDPTTRIAWDQAREAAIAVGIQSAALLPQLTASALTGFQRQATPLPNYLSRRGYLTSNGAALFPKLELSYLLFDFGQTSHRVAQARDMALAANYGFTQAHQALILAVTRAYYAYDASAAALVAANDAVAHADFLLQAADALRAHGEGTITQIAIAQRNAAQARFERDRATAAQHAARYALLEAMGLPPTQDLAIRTTQDVLLPDAVPPDIQRLLDQALQARPDILADLARLRAADEEVLAARAALAPRVAIAADVQGYLGALKTYGTFQEAPTARIAQPETGAFLQMTWPLYQGGLRANSIRLAETRATAARDTLAKATLSAERDVATAQDALATSLSEVRSARAASRAANTAYDAASRSYQGGVGTLTDASTASDAFSIATAQLAAARAQALTNAAALAYAVGQLTSAADVAPGSVTAAP